MLDIVRKIDFLSPNPELKTFNMSRFKNDFGAFMSILTLVLMGSFSLYFAYITFSRQNVSININVESNDNPAIINFATNPIIIWIYSSTGSVICDYEQYINVTMAWFQLNENTKDFITTKLKVEKNSNLTFDVPSMDQSWLKCGVILDPNDPFNKNLTLYGLFGTPYNYTVLSPYINRCVNSTENNNFCKSDAAISNFTANFYLVLGIHSFTFDTKNFTTPATKIFNTYAYNMGSSLYREVMVRLEEVQFITDTGFVFEDLKTEIYYEVTDPLINYNIGENNELYPRNFARLMLMHHPQVTKNYRNYSKIQDLVANVGGVIKGIITVAMIIEQFLVDATYTNALGNFLLNIDILNEKKTKISEINDNQKSENLKTNNVLIMSRLNHIKLENKLPTSIKNLPTVNKEVILKKLSKNYIQENLSFKDSTFRYCCKNRKIKRVNLIENFISRHTNIEYIIKQLISLTKMRKVLFTKDERTMLKYIPNVKEDCNYEKLDTNIFNNKLYKTDDEIKKIIKKDRFTELETKIYEYFNKEYNN